MPTTSRQILVHTQVYDANNQLIAQNDRWGQWWPDNLNDCLAQHADTLSAGSISVRQPNTFEIMIDASRVVDGTRESLNVRVFAPSHRDGVVQDEDMREVMAALSAYTFERPVMPSERWVYAGSCMYRPCAA
jgi:hypothetical protein